MYEISKVVSEMSDAMFIAQDGSYGDASDIAIIDRDSIDEHFLEMLECAPDWQMPDFARWFVDNDHKAQGSDDDCTTCIEHLEEMKKYEKKPPCRRIPLRRQGIFLPV